MRTKTVEFNTTTLSSLLALGLLLTTWSGELHALDPTKTLDQYVYRTWGREHGLPIAGGNDVAQDDQGYIWVATQSGLVRYNGSQFVTFTKDNTNGKVLSNYLYFLQRDHQGRIWFSGQHSLGYTKDGEFTPVHLPAEFTNNPIVDFTVDPQSRPWVALEGTGVLIMDGTSHQLLTTKDGLPSNEVNAVFEDSVGSHWIGTDKGLFKIRSDGESMTYTRDHGFEHTDVHEVAAAPDGTIWTASPEGLCHYSSERFHCTDFGRLGRLETAIHVLVIDTEGNKWIATESGLIRYHEGRIDTEGVPSNLVGAGFRGGLADKEGNLWLCTAGSGIVQIKEGKVQEYIPFTDEANIVWALAEDSAGTLWLGTQKGAVNRLSDGSVIRYTSEDGLFGDPIYSLVPARDGGVWLATAGGGLTHVDHEGKLHHWNERPDWTFPTVHAMAETPDGQLLLGTKTRGLLIFSKTGELLKHFDQESGLPGARVSMIVPSPSRGGYWISLYGGLVHYLKGRIRQIPLTGAPENIMVLHPFEDEERRVWFGTVESGLGVIIGTQTSLLTKKHGLPANTIYSILPHGDDLWLSSDIGVIRVAKKELLAVAAGTAKTVQAELFDESDGLSNAECVGANQYTAWESTDGRLLFAAIHGVIVVSPEQIRYNTYAPPVLLEEVRTNDEPLLPNSVLATGSYRLDLQWAGLSYTMPEEVRFKYILEGSDKSWSKIVADNTVRYTNLTHGDYTFKVMAANNDGVWNETPAQISFSIEPPYYLKAWFWILCAVGLGLVITVLVLVISHFVKRRAQFTSDLAWKRTRAILEGQVEAIRSLISGASNVSRDMQDLMGQLNTSSEQVAAAVSETATTVDELERTGFAAEKNAEQIIKAVENTAKEAASGRETVERSVRTMLGIQEDALLIEQKTQKLTGLMAKIESIISMVGEISEQSAVLSINAAIEASKAGDYGSGFGIVAENMQALSGRSRDATLEIAEILYAVSKAIADISKISKKGGRRMENGVSSIQESGRVVGNLADEVADNARLAQTISQSIEQQITGLRYIARAVGEFTSTVENNKTISGNVAIGTHALGQSIKDLLETIENWKTPEFYQ